MPRVYHVKKARKDRPHVGIKRGDAYYWWKFRNGPKRFSKTRPRPSQLTQSDKKSQVLGAREEIEDAALSDIADAIQSAAGTVQDVAEEYRDSVSAMPDNLQEGATAERMNEVADALDDIGSELESVDVPETDDEDELEAARKQALDAFDNADWEF